MEWRRKAVLNNFSCFLVLLPMPESDSASNRKANSEAAVRDLPTTGSPENAGSLPLETSSGTLLPKVIQFRDIARCGNEIWIQHEGKLYRLQSTKQGKLVLTK